MRLRTKKFLEEKFGKYYSNNQLKTPPSLSNREWGFIPLNKDFPEKTVMKRHKSFSTKQQLQSYLQSIIPVHVYFSSAYYERPSAPIMEEKEWKAADLVFDLDADHLVGAKNLTYQEMLKKVKEETMHLLFDFLINDFGIDRDELELVFSGGRGYHIHVREEGFLDLNSQERREIIDYILGRGTQSLIKEKKKKGAKIPYLSSKGTNWNNRIKYYLFNNILPEIASKEKKDAINKLTSYNGVGEKTAKRIYRSIEREETLDRIKKNGQLDIARGIPKSFWEQLIEEAKQQLKANADEPVTSDIKRLIRLPTSLHGGTGFRVTPLSITEIEQFNPFVNAVVFEEDSVKIYSKDNYETTLMNKKIKIEKDEIKEIPEYAAIFLSCIGKVEVEGW